MDLGLVLESEMVKESQVVVYIPQKHIHWTERDNDQEHPHHL